MADYTKATDDQLRQELARRNLDTRGDRDALIARLTENDSSQSGSDDSAEAGQYDAKTDDELRSLLAEKGLPNDGERMVLLSRLQVNEGDGSPDRSKQFPGAGDERQTRGTTTWEDPEKRGEDTGFVSTADTKPGTTKAVDKDQPQVPATPS